MNVRGTLLAVANWSDWHLAPQKFFGQVRKRKIRVVKGSARTVDRKEVIIFKILHS